jgi:hypothetical protein
MRDPAEKHERDEIGSDSSALRQAAEQISAPPEPAIVRAYVDGNGKPAPQIEAVTLDRAARDYAGVRAAEKLVADSETAKALAQRVDALRAEALADDPEAAEYYGFEPPETTSEAEKRKDDATPRRQVGHDQEQPRAGLDPELEKALQHPLVVQAIEQKVGEAEKARQEYRDGLAAATQIAQASFLGQFPEFAGVPPESLPRMLEQMARQDPAKLARIQAMVSATEQLFAQQALDDEHRGQMAQQSFLRFARAEDGRLEAMLKGEPRETRFAVANEIVAAAQESGVEAAELTRLFDTEPLMRSAVFQRMMYDAGKYRLMMKARDAVLARPLPHVQRPGAASAERGQVDLRTLSARLSTSGSIKDAVALYQARKSSKR